MSYGLLVMSYEKITTMSERKIIIKEKNFAFASRIVKLFKYLAQNKHEYVIGKQLLRSGTAVGALVREAQNTESTADFIHKLGIAQKECDETIFWLELLKDNDFLTEKEFESINQEGIELLKIIRSIIISTKQKNNS